MNYDLWRTTPPPEEPPSVTPIDACMICGVPLLPSQRYRCESPWCQDHAVRR